MKFDRGYTLKEISDLIGSKVLSNNFDKKVFGLKSLLSSDFGDLTFFYNNRYLKKLHNIKATAVIVKFEHISYFKIDCLVIDDPKFALVKIMNLFSNCCIKSKKICDSVVFGNFVEVEFDVSIGENCVIGDNVIIGSGTNIQSGVFIGNNCAIGKNCYLNSSVVLYDRVKLGNNCTINANSTLGSDGFGFVKSIDGWVKIPHLGGVKLGNFVDIGSNTSIDRGMLDDTIIGDNVIIDNHVQIGHNVVIGNFTAIA
ncbi:MAG: UDP-3-O-(3-hydroxymyristoyl)glucosamine N-acyltransferase, partial [Enterobacteriaceae bacterium]|nr:UDP-3-O-(3-hydroxymyristoyl)glucosamine N-acyltransferase [Enterobacteriaceae bacterium]